MVPFFQLRVQRRDLHSNLFSGEFLVRQAIVRRRDSVGFSNLLDSDEPCRKTEFATLRWLDATAARRFVKSLALPGGGFRAGTWDDAVDVEYTFYGLGALGLLAH